LQQLQRYTKRLTLALDPDAAGIQATLRGVEVAREALDQEWEPVFDPRGLVGYEARLEAEIRVLRLPRGQDPDDVIRESPEKWATLVEDAVPVVDFYLQLLLEDLNLEDTKAKAAVVDTLVPVLRAVANPVEREDYAQKIARALRVDARAVSARLRRTERQAARRQRAAALPQERPLSGETLADLESHCLSTLLQRRDLLGRVNQALNDKQLEPMQAQDFQNVGSRAIFEAWETLLANASPNPVEALHDQLPADLQTRLQELLAPGDSQLADEQLVRDLGLTFLRLRARNLNRLGQELGQLTREAQESGDLRAQEYAAAWRSHTTSLRRTWRALAQRWRWTS
jgi:DNA primase